jgi:4-diphosphocytidyl-2-C-methyl-D-erythritol kinase
MREIRLRAMSKINLGLDVLGKREDGYHDLRMIMQTVSLFDRITLRMTKASGIRIQTNLGFLPADASNLAVRAAQLLFDEFSLEGGLFIDLEKHIPVAAGLAGGSSDAAAVLFGVNELFGLKLTREQLMERGLKLGADVPFCVLRGTALAEGVGEILTSTRPMPPCHILLAKPPVHVSTKFVFGNLRADEILTHPDIDGQLKALEDGDLKALADKMGNVLEAVTVPAYPVIRELKAKMMEGGAIGAMMSGSGPTVFGLFDYERAARAVCDKIRQEGSCRQVYLAAPYQPQAWQA